MMGLLGRAQQFEEKKACYSLKAVSGNEKALLCCYSSLNTLQFCYGRIIGVFQTSSLFTAAARKVVFDLQHL